MAGDFKLVTEWFLAGSFSTSLLVGLTLSDDNIVSMDCNQILDRFEVKISGAYERSLRCPSQNEISAVSNAPGPLFFPDAFSPNGDGVHDTFMIQNLWDYPVNHMRIYDQGGATVFETDSYHLNWWNGKYGNTGGMVPRGTYYYVCTIDHEVVKQSFVFVSY